MKSKILLVIALGIFSVNAFAQSGEARKVDNFGYLPCGDFMGHLDAALSEQFYNPGSKIYVLYYEGKYHRSNVWNKKLKRFETKLVAPRQGNALKFAKEVVLYAKSRKFDVNKIVLVNGGHREELTLEMWIVPNGAAAPRAAPTVDKKDVIFSKGNALRNRKCWKIYDGY